MVLSHGKKKRKPKILNDGEHITLKSSPGAVIEYVFRRRDDKPSRLDDRGRDAHIASTSKRCVPISCSPPST